MADSDPYTRLLNTVFSINHIEVPDDWSRSHIDQSQWRFSGPLSEGHNSPWVFRYLLTHKTCCLVAGKTAGACANFKDRQSQHTGGTNHAPFESAVETLADLDTYLGQLSHSERRAALCYARIGPYAPNQDGIFRIRAGWNWTRLSRQYRVAHDDLRQEAFDAVVKLATLAGWVHPDT